MKKGQMKYQSSKPWWMLYVIKVSETHTHTHTHTSTRQEQAIQLNYAINNNRSAREERKTGKDRLSQVPLGHQR